MSRSESSVASEKQFLLRLLPKSKADVVRQAIGSGQPLDDRLQIECLTGSRGGPVRHAKVSLDGQLMHGKMMDLPCVVESHKTLDRKSLYKTGDISQMMVCTDCTEEDIQLIESELDNAPAQRESRKQFMCNYGLVPPLKNVRKKRFRRTAPKKCLDMETPEVEKEVRRLLREDIQAVNVSIDVVSDDLPPTKLAEGDNVGDEDDGDDMYHGNLYGQLQLSSSDSSDESLYGASGDSADDHDLDMDASNDDSGHHMAAEPLESAEVMELRKELSRSEQMIENQEMRVRDQSNPFLKERFLQRLTDLKAKRETILAQIESSRK